MNRSLPVVLSLLGPLLVFGLWSRLVFAGTEDPEEVELVEAHDELAALDADLVQRQPEIILIGSSNLGRGIDEDALAQQLGLPKGKVYKLWVHSTVMPHWYLMAKNRVLANPELQPKAIVIAGTLRRLLSTELNTELQWEKLAMHRLPDEPAIEEKVLGNRSGAMGDLALGKARLVGGLTDWVKEMTVGLLFAEPGEEGVRAAGKALADASLERLYGGEDARDMELLDQVGPVVVPEKRSTASGTGSVSVQSSLLPDLALLAEDTDVPIYLLQMPVMDAHEDFHALTAEDQREVIDFLNAHQMGWLDLSRSELPDPDWLDATHLNKKGRARYTPMVADAMKARDLLSGAPPSENTLTLAQRLQTTLVREGEVPSVPGEPVAKDGCLVEQVVSDWPFLSQDFLVGDGAGPISPVQVRNTEWLLEPGANDIQLGRCDGRSRYEGGVLTWSVPEGVTGLAPVLTPELPQATPVGEVVWLVPGTDVVVETRGFEEVVDVTLRGRIRQVRGNKNKLAVTVDDTPVKLKKDGQRWWVFSHQTRVGDGDLRVTLHSEGSWAAMTHLELTVGEERAELIGQDFDAGTAIEAPALTRSSKISWARPAPVFAETAPRELVAGKAAMAITVGPLAEVSEVQVLRHAQVPKGSPVEVFLDGEPVDNRGCGLVRQGRQRSFCHLDAQILVTDATEASELDQDWTFQIAEDRARRGVSWLYPRDQGTLPLDPGLAALGGQVDEVRLVARDYSGSEQPRVILRLLGNQRSVNLVADLDPEDDEVVIELGKPLALDEFHTLELFNATDGFVLVSELVFVRR